MLGHTLSAYGPLHLSYVIGLGYQLTSCPHEGSIKLLCIYVDQVLMKQP